MRWQPSALSGSLLVIFTYMVVRAALYHFYPIISEESWFIRDSLMCLPRLGAFAALLWLNRTWQVAPFDFPLKDLGRIALFGFVPLALWVFYFSGGRGETHPPLVIYIGCFTSLIVGLFEEYAFRGPLLTVLRQRTSALFTIISINLLFTLYHIQAQPIATWGMVFLTGVIMTNLRLRGLSLGSLALLHGLIDTSYFIFPVASPDPFNLHGLVLQNGLLAFALLTYPGSIRKDS